MIIIPIQDLSAKCCKRKCAQCPAYPRVDGDPVWYSPASLSAVMEILATHDNVKLITGDTGRGDYTVIVVVLDHCSLLSYRCVQGT